MKKLNFLILFFCLFSSPLLASTAPWPAQTARSWYENQPWLVGANYIPAYAINQLEMWQAESLSPKTIDGELAIAEHIGLNSMRVFLHDLLWAQDSAGFSQRIDLFLQIASRHHIRPIFVLFDSCWDPRPHLGKQKNPVAGVHNSGWVQSPGVNALLDPTQLPRLQSYVTGIVGRFSRDPRILGWDVWNEPENLNLGSYNDTNAKLLAVQTMLPKVFDWARAGGPMQPLTSPLWTGDWSNDVNLSVVQRIQISLSDVISFHSYDPA